MGQKYLKTVQRTFDIIRYISENQHRGVTLKEISQKFGKTPGTILPILNTLIFENIIVSKHRAYKLSPGILRLSYSITSEMDVKTVGRKYLEIMAREMEGNSHLGVMSDNRVIYVDRVVNSPRGYVFANIVGMIAPAYRTGLGKALMAFQDGDVIEKYVTTETFEKYTPYTITDKGRFLEELGEIRKRGYSFDIQESNEGVSCVGVPVFTSQEVPVCAISISVPHSKFMENRESLVKRMLEIAKKIGTELIRIEG
jgi:IclR family KDG regulon transcriptional repressor